MARNKSSSSNQEKCATEAKEIKKKRKIIIDENAPKRPSGAYIVYTAKTYEGFVATHPEIKDRHQIMKAMAEHWRQMTEDEKKPFIDEVKTKQVEYEKQMEEYKKTDNYRNFMECKKELQKKSKESKKRGSKSEEEPTVATNSGEVPIFSDQFMEHNRNRQLYLNKVRREISDLDEEEFLIHKNIVTLQDKYHDLYDSNRTDDNVSKLHEKTVTKWHKLVINALDNAKLLGYLNLNQKSTVDEVIQALEEVNKKSNEQLKNCLNSINFG